MAKKKPTKKRRRKAPTENEKPAPTRVLRWRSPDVGTKYTVLYDRHCKYGAILLRLGIDPTVNGAHLDPAGYDPEMAKFISEFSSLRVDLVEAGEQLQSELDDDGADLVERLAIRKWADPQLFEDLQVVMRKWRRKRDAEQSKPSRETTAVAKRDDEHAALIVDKGRLQIKYNGCLCHFKDSNTFDLMIRFAEQPGVAIQGDRTDVFQLRRRFRENPSLTPIAEAINSKRNSRYMLDADAIGGVKLV